MTDAPRRAILVLGMHRSGTSLVTRLIGYLGAAMPADAMAEHADNARGFWESVAVAKAGDTLLRAARSSWFDPRPLDLSRVEPAVLRSCEDRLWRATESAFGAAPLFAMKDPRQCRFVPLIRRLFAEHGVESRAVLVVRPAEAVAHSLRLRDGTSPAFAQVLWLRHMLEAERATRELPRIVVGYDDVLADWRRTAKRLLPLVGRDALPNAETCNAIAAFVDKRLRHHGDQGGSAPFGPVLAELVAAVAEALRSAAARDDVTAWRALDAAQARLDGERWLVDDIIHDELRHRRVQAVQQQAQAASPLPIAVPPPAPASPTAAPAGETDLAEVVATIRGSGLFDEGWYATTYPDAVTSGLDPIAHYVMVGAALGFNPHPLFDTAFYAQQMARRIATQGEP